MKNRFLTTLSVLTLGTAVLGLGMAPAQASKITFEAENGKSGNTNTTFTEGGYTLTYTNVFSGFFNIASTPDCVCATDGTTVFTSFNTGTLGISVTGGGGFSAQSLDLAQTFTGMNRPLDVLVTGQLSGGGTVTDEFKEADGNADIFHTFSLTSQFTNLSSLTIQGVGSYPTTEFEVDNIVLSSTSVPEPASMALLGVGLLGTSVMARRRRFALIAIAG